MTDLISSPASVLYRADGQPVNLYGDAFGRLRVSNPQTLFDSKMLYGKGDMFWAEKIVGGATSVHVPADAAVDMQVSSGIDQVIRQTIQHHNYQPGKSQQLLFTFLADQDTDVTKRIGYFSATDGLFYEVTGTDVAVVVRKNSTDTRITQANWNIDSLDGSGPSGLTLDPSAVQIFTLDFEWLGVGSVLFGFFIDRAFIPIHQQDHANQAGKTSVYMSTPNLPIRYEILSSGGSGSLHHICSTVMSEGGHDEIGCIHSVSRATNNTLPMAGGSADSVFALLVVRLKADRIGTTMKPLNFSTMLESNGLGRAMLLYELDESIIEGDALTWNAINNSGCEVAFGNVTNVINLANIFHMVASGYFTADSDAIRAEVTSGVGLGEDIDGNRSVFIVALQPFGSNETAGASLGWRELS